MKLRTIEEFFDMKAGIIRKPDDTFDVDDARAKELTTSNNNAKRILCEVVKEPGKKPTAKKTVKKEG